VAGERLVSDPAAFVATASRRRYFPTTALSGEYVNDVAPTMTSQVFAFVEDEHIFHWYVIVGVGAPEKSVWPATVYPTPAFPVGATELTSVGAIFGSGITELEAVEAVEVPMVLVAVTVNVYEVPFVSPDTTIGLCDPVAVAPPGDAVTVYEEIGEPFAPAPENAIVACASPGVAVTVVGADGSPAGITADDAVDASEFPTELTATTENVYEVPFVSPVTLHVVFGAVAVHVLLPGLEVTM